MSDSAKGIDNCVTVDLEDLEVTPHGQDRASDFTLPGSREVVRFV